MGLAYFGGTFGGLNKPTKFLCLVLKMLQLQPEKDIIIEFIKQSEFKYVRVLGAFYLRLVGKPADICKQPLLHNSHTFLETLTTIFSSPPSRMPADKYLELLYNDYRKIRHRTLQGKFCPPWSPALLQRVCGEVRLS